MRRLALYSSLLPPVVVRRRLLGAAVLASFALGASAPREDRVPAKLSAEEFLARVGKSHPSLELLEAAVEGAAAKVKAAGAWANPELSFEREEVFPGGRGQPENFVRLALPVELSGGRGLRLEGAQLGLEAARAASAGQRSRLLFEALGVYWSAATARQGLDLLRQERESLVGLVQAVRSRTSAGDTSGYDLDRLELELELLDDLVAEAERELDGRQRQLALLAGAPGERFEASDALALPPPPPPVPGLVQQALDFRDDCKAARLRLAQAEREVSAAGRGWVPGVTLAGGAKSSTPAENQTAWGYVAGLSLTLPVFDHGQGEAARARARLRQAQAEQRSLEAQVTTDVLTAHGALTRALSQADRFEQAQVPRLERIVRRAQVSYREGERPVFELLDAFRTARGVRLRSLGLRGEARRSELELRRALGRGP